MKVYIFPNQKNVELHTFCDWHDNEFDIIVTKSANMYTLDNAPNASAKHGFWRDMTSKTQHNAPNQEKNISSGVICQITAV